LLEQNIEWRYDGLSFFSLQMQVHHGCGDGAVAEQFFDGMDVGSGIEQVRGK